MFTVRFGRGEGNFFSAVKILNYSHSELVSHCPFRASFTQASDWPLDTCTRPIQTVTSGCWTKITARERLAKKIVMSVQPFPLERSKTTAPACQSERTRSAILAEVAVHIRMTSSGLKALEGRVSGWSSVIYPSVLHLGDLVGPVWPQPLCNKMQELSN